MRVTDPRAIRALAHPLRLDLLELLGGISPATAARCAAVLGVSQASASYHLRQLAQYGFVEAGEPSGDQRERPWRLVSRHQRVSIGHDAAVDELDRVSVEREVTKILEFVDRRQHEAPDWRDAAFRNSLTLPMTVDELRELSRQFEALLGPYLARIEDGAPPRLPRGGRWVRVFLAGTPYPEFDLDELRFPPTDDRSDDDGSDDDRGAV
jgi:DNA-binding transcriptional ArsR family regulator